MGGAFSLRQRCCSIGCSGCWPSASKAAKLDISPKKQAKTPATTDANTDDTLEKEGRAWRVLHAILAIERKCLCSTEKDADACWDNENDADGGLSIECMLDEPTRKYFLCSSLSSPTVIAYFCVQFSDLCIADLVHALVDTKERQLRDHDSEYQVVRIAEKGDPIVEEDVAYVMRAPWPFSDRDILHHRWQLPLGLDEDTAGRNECASAGIKSNGGGAMAIVMQSFEDENLLPLREDRVRAFIHKAAYLVRPLKEAKTGCELAVCNQLDIGGLCPAWAHKFLTRFAMQRGIRWSEELHEHCVLRQTGLPKSPSSSHKSEAEDLELLTPSIVVPPPREVAKTVTTSGKELLDAVLEIERQCLDAGDGEEHTPNGLRIEHLLDEPEAQYFLCSALDSPTVMVYLRVELHDVNSGDVWRALVDCDQQLRRDPASEYQILRKAREGDLTLEEDVAYVWRAVWPFWDRDILSRRWSLPLPANSAGGDGIAVVMRSFDDDLLLPQREDRVRAFIHKCAYLLRPVNRDDYEESLELAVCQQVDMGGVCPEWAQELLTRYAVDSALRWAEELREHCLKVQKERAPVRDSSIMDQVDKAAENMDGEAAGQDALLEFRMQGR